jgi:hypothetical protein
MKKINGKVQRLKGKKNRFTITEFPVHNKII